MLLNLKVLSVLGNVRLIVRVWKFSAISISKYRVNMFVSHSYEGTTTA